MKKKNPRLKTLLATGGWNAGSKPYSDMVATKANRTEFILSTIDYLRTRDFDGLDLDWEYPTKRGGRPEDKARLVLLLEVCFHNSVDHSWWWPLTTRLEANFVLRSKNTLRGESKSVFFYLLGTFMHERLYTWT